MSLQAIDIKYLEDIHCFKLKLNSGLEIVMQVEYIPEFKALHPSILKTVALSFAGTCICIGSKDVHISTCNFSLKN